MIDFLLSFPILQPQSNPFSMRIRKNGKFPALLFLQSLGLEALQCQLNQSPWDVIPFSEDACQSSLRQFERESSFNEIGTSSDSVGVVERTRSIVSLMGGGGAVDNKVIDDNIYEMAANPEKKKKKKVFDDNKEMEKESEFKFKKVEKITCCNKTDGKGWQCQNRHKEGHSTLDHHFTSIKSYKSNYKNHDRGCLDPFSTSIKRSERGPTGATRSLARTAEKRRSSSSSDAYEFYYYSGFGPWRGKKRGERGEGHKSREKNAATNGAISITITTSPNRTASPASPVESKEHFHNDMGKIS